MLMRKKSIENSNFIHRVCQLIFRGVTLEMAKQLRRRYFPREKNVPDKSAGYKPRTDDVTGFDVIPGKSPATDDGSVEFERACVPLSMNER